MDAAIVTENREAILGIFLRQNIFYKSVSITYLKIKDFIYKKSASQNNKTQNCKII